jgi:anaerobic magnesium-protoporphyrin IX monomethyl ester cyclase
VAARKIPVLVIGPFATSVPAPYVAAGAKVVCGEPEMFFHATRLASAADARALPDVIPAAPTADVDALGCYPAWDVMAGSRPRMRFIGPGLVIPLLATRGCPYSCSYYCTYPLQQGRKVRSRAPAEIVKEMGHWQDTLGASAFIFRDPVFSIDRRNTLALCDEIERSGRTFAFGIETHLKNLDAELAGRLKRVGLKLVYVGIESVTPEVIAAARRFSLPLDEQSERVARAESLGIRIKAMYIFGLPKDTVESCRATIRYALALKSTYAQFNIFTPYPGTPVFQEYRGRITSQHYEDFTQSDLVFRHEHLSAADARRLLGDAYSTYYTNPAWWLRSARRAWA